MDTNPQCSVWASTGQCSTNAMMMRQTCALSCGTCSSGLGGLGGIGTSSIYNPFGGLGTTGLDQYPLSQFIGRSIYETGLLNRQPNPIPSKNIGIITKAKSVQLPTR
uniref:ShKT domain-containing protein n=1 Tax=Caenorhabditis tropicalis TaxID=1561998 RepID=A0A1I7U7S3_9PELO